MNKKIINCVSLIICLTICSCSFHNDSGIENRDKIAENGDRAVSKDKLRIYSLKESSIRQAVSLFQEKCPEVEVTFEVGCTGENGMTLSDAVRTLNTELMSGDGPDILILDGLNSDEYIKKGILEDVTSIVESEKEKLFYNIITAYNGAERIYRVPTSFRVPVILGDAEATTAKNMDELMGIIEKRADSGIPLITLENFSSFAGNLFITSDVLQETVNAGDLTKFYNDLKMVVDRNDFDKDGQTINESDKLIYWAEQYPEISSVPELDLYFDKAQIGVDILTDCSTYMKILSVCKEKGLSCQYLNKENGNQFIAENILGINSNGKHIDTAKQFLSYYLSGDPQRAGVYSGFSIDRETMKEAMYVSENGEWYSFTSRKDSPDDIMNMYELTPLELQELITFFEELDTPVKDDAVVLQKVMKQADACLFEGKDPESAAMEISSEVNLYLIE